MNCNLTSTTYKKIGIFTDIHYGRNKDDIKKLDQLDSCIDWIINTFKKQKIDWIFFMGDWFESRFSINVNTLNHAVNSFKKVCNSFEHVFMILGNHDIYYKNVNNINSIKFFGDLAKNVTIVEDTPFMINNCGYNLLLVPWGADIDQIKKDKPKIDYMFGHFEVNGMELVGSVQTGAQYDMSTLFEITNYTFTGHYHIHKQYDKNNKIILSLGCPLQLDWGDFNKNKYIATLDVSDEQKPIELFKNNVSATFEKIYLSKIKNKIYKDLPTLLKDNYIKFVVDDKCDFNNILVISNKLKTLNPSSLEVEYLHSLTDDVDFNSIDIAVEESKDVLQYIIEYVEKVYNEIKTNYPNTKINKDLLIKKITYYYNKNFISNNDSTNIDEDNE